MSRPESHMDKQPTLLMNGITAYCLVTDFTKKYRPIMEPHNWTEYEIAKMVEYVNDYFELHRSAPTVDALQMYIEEDGLKEEEQQLLEAFLDKIADTGSRLKTRDVIAVDDRFEHLIRYRVYRKAAGEAFELIQAAKDDDRDSRLEQAAEVVAKAQLVRLVSDDWLVLPDNFDAYYTYFDKAALERVTLPTGITELDKRIGGGLRPGELGVWAAGPGTGKSMTLVHCGAVAARDGKNVIHFSFENSAEETLGRYTANLLNTDQEILREGRVESDFDGLVDLCKQQGIGQVWIQKLLGTRTTINDLDQAIQHLKDDKGINADLIIVDYGDMMRPTISAKDKYEAQGIVFQELRDLACLHHAPLWTATQGNRESSKKSTRLHHVADSWAKTFVADVVLTVSRPKKQRDEQKVVNDHMGNDEEEDEQATSREICIAKLRRDGEDNKVIVLETNFAQAKYLNDEEGQEQSHAEAIEEMEKSREQTQRMKAAKGIAPSGRLRDRSTRRGTVEAGA